MTTVDRRDRGLDSGHLAVVGHQLLGSAAVVAGGVTTLRDADGVISREQRALVGRQITRNLDVIMEIARSLIRGEIAGDGPSFPPSVPLSRER